MSIEDDMINAFKHINLGKGVDPLKMLHGLLTQIERDMLKRMLAQINARLDILKGEDTELDPFSILGVTPDSTKEEVTKAYRGKAAEHHPDKGGTTEDMAKVNAAYEAIRIFKEWK